MGPSEQTEALGESQYAVLTTYRRDGTPVGTAVWISRSGDELYVWTRADSGKVKRLRHTPRVELAPSDNRGRARGPARQGSARVLDQEGAERVTASHRRKYGIRFVLFAFAGRLASFRTGGEVGVAIRLDEVDDGGAPSAGTAATG